MASAGAWVDGVRVRIPPHLIQDAVAANPQSFTLWSRDAQKPLQLVPDRVYFGPGPTCTYFIDPISGDRRKARRGDPGLVARVCDALPNIDYVMSLGLIDDVTHQLAPVYEFAEMVSNSRKPVLAWAYSVDNVSDIYEIALAAAGDEAKLRHRPFFGLFSTFHSPLQHTAEDLANVLWAVERDVPVVYLGGATAGSSGPITGAGSMVVSLAGALSGLAIIHLKKRGAQVCIGGVLQPTDLRTARPAYGAPEMSLYGAAMADVCRYLGLPFMGTAGASEAKTVDVQAAIESAVQVVLSCLSGATLVHDVGFLDCADIGSLEMLVMNDEIIGMMRRVLRGVEITDDTLMLDLIDRIGPGGEFMSTKETAKRCRAEIWVPTLMNRDPWVQWDASGSTTMGTRIKAKVDHLLSTHVPLQLPDGASGKIEAILTAAEARSAGSF